ncbi:hypothetical protein EMIT07CA2_190005 [Brevibacillus sp. IT-7CA2]
MPIKKVLPAHMIGRISRITGSIFKLGIVFSIKNTPQNLSVDSKGCFL